MSTCAECGRHRAVPGYDVCRQCWNEYMRGLDRRRDAERRLGPTS